MLTRVQPVTVAASSPGLSAAGSESPSPVGVPAELAVPFPLVVGAGPPQLLCAFE